VEQPAEEVAPPDLARMNHRCGRRIGSAAAIRRSQVERSVWTLLGEVETRPLAAVVEAHQQVARLLCHPRRIRLARTSDELDPARPVETKNST